MRKPIVARGHQLPHLAVFEGAIFRTNNLELRGEQRDESRSKCTM